MRERAKKLAESSINSGKIEYKGDSMPVCMVNNAA
jgi:hypothetical protein